jgi:hypothetical protein
MVSKIFNEYLIFSDCDEAKCNVNVQRMLKLLFNSTVKPFRPPVTKESHYSIFYSSFLAYLHTYNRDNNNNNEQSLKSKGLPTIENKFITD